jgi:hypothetical protein
MTMDLASVTIAGTGFVVVERGPMLTTVGIGA